MNRIYLIFLILLFGSIKSLYAQDLLDILKKEEKDQPNYAMGTFKMTRIGIGHSVETPN